MGTMTLSDRLHIEVEKWLIDTGAPNSHRFFLKDKPKDSYEHLITTSRWNQHIGFEEDVPQQGLKEWEYALSDVAKGKVKISTMLYCYPSQRAMTAWKNKEGTVGIIGMDVLKQCALLWVASGIILVPEPHSKAVFNV